MTHAELRQLAAWHGHQAELHERDAALCAHEVEALCRARNQAYYHRQTEQKLRALADAFATLAEIATTAQRPSLP